MDLEAEHLFLREAVEDNVPGTLCDNFERAIRAVYYDKLSRERYSNGDTLFMVVRRKEIEDENTEKILKAKLNINTHRRKQLEEKIYWAAQRLWLAQLHEKAAEEENDSEESKKKYAALKSTRLEVLNELMRQLKSMP
jgi:hypothetical protein